MVTEECTRIACYLSQGGGIVSFPILTVAGLVDGVNPCAIGMMVMLLGYLLVFAKKPRRVLKTGFLYIVTVFLTYLVVGLGLYSFVKSVDFSQEARMLNIIVGAILLISGLVQFKDFLGIEKGPHLQIPVESRDKLRGLIEKVSYPATVALGVLVTILETPCSLPIYVGTATILANSGLSKMLVLGYFLYYNLLFVLPLVVVLVIVWRGKRLAEIKEWEHKAKRWMHLSLSMVLLLMGIWLLS